MRYGALVMTMMLMSPVVASAGESKTGFRPNPEAFTRTQMARVTPLEVTPVASVEGEENSELAERAPAPRAMMRQRQSLRVPNQTGAVARVQAPQTVTETLVTVLEYIAIVDPESGVILAESWDAVDVSIDDLELEPPEDEQVGDDTAAVLPAFEYRAYIDPQSSQLLSETLQLIVLAL